MITLQCLEKKEKEPCFNKNQFQCLINSYPEIHSPYHFLIEQKDD